MHITVRTQFEGLHYWKDAPDEVAFLRNLHRHVFKVEVCLDVAHDNRDLEFFMVKSRLDQSFERLGCRYNNALPFLRNLGQMSCEMIASWIMKNAHEGIYSGLVLSVTVREDDENSGTVTRGI